MNLMEVIVVGMGLAVGYWGVSSLMSAPRKPGAQEPRNDRGGAWHQSPGDRQTNDPGETWFDTLGVPETAPMDVITQAYKRLIRQYHPDKVANLGTEFRSIAEAKSKQINVAYARAQKIRAGR